VTFNSAIDAREVPGVSELPKNHIWYNLTDYEAITMDVQETIAIMSRNDVIDDDEHCPRGLEPLTEEGANQSREVKRTVFDAVLDKQIDLWSEGCYKPEDLAREYRNYSALSTKDAWIRAQQDEREARDLVGEALAICETEGSTKL
jgi:hypothetical protein